MNENLGETETEFGAAVPRKLHLGCGRTILPDFLNVDYTCEHGANLAVDLENCQDGFASIPDAAFDSIIASHVLEHISNILPLMQELHRMAAPNCEFLIRVPYGASIVAFEDPTHVRFFYPQSFGYFGQPWYHRADYGYRGDWRIEKVEVYVQRSLIESFSRQGLPIQFALQHFNNIVDEMAVKLIAVKPIRPPNRNLQENIKVDVVPIGASASPIVVPKTQRKQ